VLDHPNGVVTYSENLSNLPQSKSPAAGLNETFGGAALNFPNV
jgi:hypothetical protein